VDVIAPGDQRHQTRQLFALDVRRETRVQTVETGG
jgi:hypothetical protein